MILFLDTKSNDMSPESSPTLSQMVISIRLVNHFFAFPTVGFSSSYGVFWDPSSGSFQNLDLHQIMASSEQQVCVFLLLFSKKRGYIQFNSYHF
jgi:hypothetical protein